MTEPAPYTYVILRYIHDPNTGEFVNVGVLLNCPTKGFFDGRIRKTFRRVKEMFPDLDSDAFKHSMFTIDRGIKAASRDYASSGFLMPEGNALSLARKILSSDDSSLQWSSLGGGVTTDPEQTLARLYQRFVSRYDVRATVRRTDDEIWKPVKEELNRRQLADRLGETTITGSADEIHFDHAYKNGRWHCIQPISFDLSNADTIMEKARRWTGHLTALQDVAGTFKPYLVLASPSQAGLWKAYAKARHILEQVPPQIGVEMYEERAIPELANAIEDVIRSSRH